MSKSANLEWQFFEETRHDDTAWQQVCNPTGELAPAVTHRWPLKRLWKEAVLVLVTTVILLAQFPWSAIFAAHKIDPTEASEIVTVETRFFRFHHQRRDAQAVNAAAANVDRWYLRLRRQFDLPAPVSAYQLTVNVGNPADRTREVALDLAACTGKGEMLLLCQKRVVARPSEDELTVPLQTIITNDPVGPAALLAGTIQDWLVGRLFNEAVERSAIKPMWQPMVGGLRHYLWLKQKGKQRQLAPELWQILHTLPLNATLPDDLRYRVQIYQWSSPEFRLGLDASQLSHIITGALADYLITTYGRDRLVRLLAGFSRYESWEKLSPAVFGVSARQLEEGWHDYLASLPPDSSFAAAKPSIEQIRYQLNDGN